MCLFARLYYCTLATFKRAVTLFVQADQHSRYAVRNGAWRRLLKHAAGQVFKGLYTAHEVDDELLRERKAGLQCACSLFTWSGC